VGSSRAVAVVSVIVVALLASALPPVGPVQAQPVAPEADRQLGNHPATAARGSGGSDLSGAVIGNGTLTLGVDRAGNVDHDGVGLRFEETGGDALIPGCWCEGWGIGDAEVGVLGWASASNPPSRLRGTVTSFTATTETARSVVVVDGALEVVHDFAPADGTPNLYEMMLTVTNTSEDDLHPTYRRAMDWDVPPQEFYEYVTIAGDHSALLESTNDGFASLDVSVPPTDLGARGTFEDFGPSDQGALFDFDLGELGPGESVQLQMYYGAAASENRALEVVDAVDGTLWSFGQPPSGSGSADGTPNTFIFTVAEQGLRFRPQPVEVYAGLEVDLAPVGGPELAHLEGETFRATITEGPGAGASDDCRYGTFVLFWGCSGRWGGLTFTADVPGTSLLDGFIDVDGDGRADGDEPSTAGRIAWLEGIDAVGLGDSFSSGQGAGDYDRELEVCERSSGAYARVLRAPNDTLISTMAEDGVVDASFGFIACGGARSFHVARAEDGGVNQHEGVPPQLDQGEVRAATDLVTITIGGNDLGFSDVVTFCARHDCSDPDREYKDGLALEEWAVARLAEVLPELRDLHAQIRDQSAGATVVVAGYPYLFPGRRDEQNCVKLTPFNNGEQDLIRGLQDVFDDALASIAAEVGVHYVSVLEHFGGHEICGEDGSWMNAIRTALRWPPVSGESFHPNAEGQRQYAEIIRRELRNRIGGDPAPTGLPRNPPPQGARAAVSTQRAADPPVLSEPARFGVAVVTPDGGASCGVHVPGDTIDYAVGDLAPGTEATLTLDADGSVLATLTADAAGEASGTFTLPSGTAQDALIALDGTSIVGGAARSYALVPVADQRPDCAQALPSVELASPADGAVHAADERVVADYACEGDDLTVCLGDLPAGDPLPDTPGEHTFSVTAQNGSGDTTVVEHRFSVGARLSASAPGEAVTTGTHARFPVARTGPWDAAEALPFTYRIDGGDPQEAAIPAGSDRVVLEVATNAAGSVTVTLEDAAHYWLGDGASATATVRDPDDGAPDPVPAACDPDRVPAAPFTDIGRNVHGSNIACVAWYGLARGTSDSTYSPGRAVTRGQMASFVARLLETAGVELPRPSDQGFGDIAGSPHADRIDQLAALGVVQGMTSSRYAPGDPVRRDQMASFLVRAYEVVDGGPLARARTSFTDVTGSAHLANIEKATAAGFTRGTSASTYAPAAAVRRDQMGSFLARVLARGTTDGHVAYPTS
jgi:lysophospholipase L1-like esterase